MKRFILSVAMLAVAGLAFAQNPILDKKYGTPYEIPPFEKLTIENYREAMLKGLDEDAKEIQAIVDCKDEPSFENVIVALDRSGELLDKAEIWSVLKGASSTAELQALASEMSPLTTAHGNAIRMNKALFAKVKYVYDNQAKQQNVRA